jgi:hypothetical protein
MGLESRPVGILSAESALRRLVLLLSGGCRHGGGEKCLVHLESFGEMLCNQRRNRACPQQFTERPMAVADITIAETEDKLGPTYPERPCALKKEPTDRVCAFPEAHPESGTSQSSVPVVVPDAADVVWRH